MQAPRYSEADKQRFRLKRFGMAATTYAIGLALLVMCGALGLIGWREIAGVAVLKLLINAGLWLCLRTGWNLRFSDPSMTLAQTVLAAGVIACIVVVGERVHFLAVTFYSVLFLFAMLQLGPWQIAWLQATVVVSYALASLACVALNGAGVDAEVEVMYLILVVVTTIWFAAAAMYIVRLRRDLSESKHTIEKLASCDGLTGVWNRRQIDAMLMAEAERAVRMGTALCVALLDIDHFKRINDRFGHGVGDAVLCGITQCMREELREFDEIGRYGGEEFLLLLPGTTPDTASAGLERLRLAIAALELLPQAPERVTVSIGLACIAPGEAPADCVRRADAALYQAKRSGRNRVVAAAAYDLPPPSRAAA